MKAFLKDTISTRFTKLEGFPIDWYEVGAIFAIPGYFDYREYKIIKIDGDKAFFKRIN